MTPMMSACRRRRRNRSARPCRTPPASGIPGIAALAIHIIENGYINGETIRIDGALRMAPK